MLHNPVVTVDTVASEEKPKRILVPVDEQRRRDDSLRADDYVSELHTRYVNPDEPLRYDPPELTGNPVRDPTLTRPVRIRSYRPRKTYKTWSKR